MAWYMALGLGASLGFGAGCQDARHGQLVAFLRAHEQVVSSGQYTVMPPDAILIHAPVAPEIDGAAQQVRPDGKVALRLLGEVDVAGLSPDQIADRLESLLARYYVEPEVVVDVARYGSQHYYVFGQVQRPGPKLLTGRDSLLEVIADAGPTFLADRTKIRVVRPAPEPDGSHVIVVNLNDMVRAGETGRNILLQAGDIVEVPPTALAWVGLRVRELLYPVTPAIDAYTDPAETVEATETYQGHDDDDDDDDGNGRLRGWR